MSETQFLGLPLLEPAQAQKHVTVNEALSRLDGVSQLVLSDIGVTNPPTQISGAYGVGSGATNAWYGQDGRIAIASNGGWEFVTPMRGWRAWIESSDKSAIFDGSGWVPGAGTLSGNGAGLSFETVEIDHTIASGASSTTVVVFPAQSVVFAVTGRVLQSITGTANGFSLGVAGVSPDRYGSGIGLAQNSWVRGISSSPVTYYNDTPLTLTAENGTFTDGEIRLCAHIMTFRLPG